jgi:hypothetical protein
MSVMNWKGFGKNRSWPNFKVLSRHSPGETEENTKTLSQDSRSPSLGLNPGLPVYETGMLTTAFGFKFYETGLIQLVSFVKDPL